MSKPATSALVVVGAVLAVTLSGASPVEAGIRDRLWDLQRRHGAATERVARGASDLKSKERPDGGPPRAAEAGWDTIYSAGEAEPHLHDAPASVSRPLAPASPTAGGHGGGHRRRRR